MRQQRNTINSCRCLHSINSQFALLPSRNQSLCCPRSTNHSVVLDQSITLLSSINQSICCHRVPNRSVALAQPICFVDLSQSVTLLPSLNQSLCCPRATNHSVTLTTIITIPGKILHQLCCPHWVTTLEKNDTASCSQSFHSLSPRVSQFSHTSRRVILSLLVLLNFIAPCKT